MHIWTSGITIEPTTLYLPVPQSNTLSYRVRLDCSSKQFPNKNLWNRLYYIILMPASALTWWRHQMETFSALLALCEGNTPITGEFPSQRPVTRGFDVSVICAWTNGCANHRDVGDLRRHRVHYDVIVMTVNCLLCGHRVWLLIRKTDAMVS